MAVNVKMGVDLSSFTSGIKEGQGILKGLNAEMKAAEAEFKATGNAEQLLANKTKTLNSQLQVQKGIAAQAAQALKAMDEAGIAPTDAAYQKLYATMMNATAGMNEAQAALNALSSGEQQAATSADNLSGSLNNIGKKISLQQVIGGIDKITGALENAGKQALRLGEAIWDNIRDTARYADDVATSATTLGMSVEDYQRYKGVFDTIGELTVQEWTKARNKVQKAIVDTSDEQFDIFAALGIGLRDVNGTISPRYNKYVIGQVRDWEDVFWDIGKALREKVANKEITQDQADVYAQALFGSKWSQYSSLFALGEEGFKKALEEQNVASEEAIKKNAELNDQLIKLEASFTTLKQEVTSALAQALTTAAESLDSLLGKILEYLATPEGQQALKDMETAVSGLFEDLGEIDPEQVVSGFVSVFDTVIDSLQWLSDHKDEVGDALVGIVATWGTLKIAGGVLTIVNLVNGLNSLLGAEASFAAAGAAAGTSFATGFVNAFVSAAPILAAMLGITAIAVTPAVATQKQYEKQWKQKQIERQLSAKEVNEQNRQFINDAAEAVGPKKNADGTYKTGAFGFLDMNPTSETARLLMDLSSRQGLQRAQLFNAINAYGKYTNGNFTTDLLTQFWANPNGEQFDEGTLNTMLQNITDALIESEKPKIEVEPQVPENAAAEISESIGAVTVPVEFSYPGGYLPEFTGGGGAGASKFGYVAYHANGLPFVPYDGYLARLHKGERVVPAREVSSRSYNSNLYVESMYMNNGMDANGLASAMAAAQRRTMSGYGS